MTFYPNHDQASVRARGNVLIIAMVFASVIGLSLIGIMNWASQQSRQTIRSKAWNAALPLAESGIEEALAHLAFTNDLVSGGWELKNGEITKTRILGTDYFVTSLLTNAGKLDIISKGHVKLPLTATQYMTRTIRVSVTNTPLFQAAVALKKELNMQGYDLIVDSFNSKKTDQSTSGLYDPSKRDDNGHVFSVMGISNSKPKLGGSKIYGQLKTGLGGLLELGDSGAVGSFAWHNSGNTGIESGWVKDDMRITFPKITSPSGALPPAGGTVNGVNYQYVLPSGKWIVDRVDGSVYVSGDASLTVTGDINIYTPHAVIIAPGASLKLFMLGWTSTFTGGGITNQTGRAVNFQYYGGEKNEAIVLAGFEEITALIYAPNAILSIGNGNKSVINFNGAIVSKDLKVMGQAHVHYDEAAREVPSPVFKLASWDEL